MKSANLLWLLMVIAMVALATRLANPPVGSSPTPEAGAPMATPSRRSPYLTWTEYQGQSTYVFKAGEEHGTNVLYQARLGQRGRTGTIAMEHYQPWMASVLHEAELAVSEQPQGKRRAELTVGGDGQSWTITIGSGTPGPATARLLKLMNEDFPGWEKQALLGNQSKEEVKNEALEELLGQPSPEP